MTDVEPTPHSTPPSLLRNALCNYAGIVVRLVVMLLLTPFVVSSVGQTGYGLWLLVGTVAGYSGLLDLGVSGALNRYLGLYVGRGDTDALNRVLGSGVAFFMGVGVLVALVLGAGAGTVANWLGLADTSASTFRPVLQLVGLAIAVELPTRVMSSLLIAHEALPVRNLIEAGSLVAYAGGVALVLALGGTLVGVAAVQLAVASVTGVVRWVVVRRLYPAVRLSPLQFHPATMRRLVAFGAFALVWVLADNLRFRIAPVVVNGVFADGVALVAVFGLAMQLINNANLLLLQGQNTLSPRFNRLVGQATGAELAGLFERASRINALLTSLGFMLMLGLGGHFILVWMGSRIDRPELVFRALWVLVPGFVVAKSQNMSVALLQAVNRHKVPAVVFVAEGVLTCGLMVLLPRWVGFLGVPLGITLPMVLTGALFLPWYTCRCLDLSVSRYLRQVLARPVLAFAGMAVPSLVLYVQFGLGWVYLGGSLALAVLSTGLVVRHEVADLLKTVHRRVAGRLSAARHDGGGA